MTLKMGAKISCARRKLMPALAVSSVVALGACDSVPDALNPAKLYDSTVAFFDDDVETPAKPKSQLVADRNKGAPGADQPFPTLGRVDSQEKKRNLGLAADPDRPRYAPAIPLQNDTTTVAAARQKRPPAPPPAVPTKGVQPGALAPAAKTAARPQQPAQVAQATPQTRRQATKPAPAARPAAAPKPAAPAAGASLGLPSQAEQQAQFQQIRARLQKQLAEINAQAQRQPAFATGIAGPGLVNPDPTVVISSGGVQSQTGVAPAFAAPVVATAGGGVPGGFAGGQAAGQLAGPLIENRGALPIPPGAVKVATIVFQNGSSGLSANDRRILSQVVDLQKTRGGQLRVVGHASSRTKNLTPQGHQQANFRVSKRRANVVAKELVRRGVASGNVLVAAVSNSQPLFYEVIPRGEAGNRRTEIYLTN